MSSKEQLLNLGLLIFIVMLAPWACLPENCETPVLTKSGWVQGLLEKESDVCSYLGLPYAAPPVAENRFRAPQDPESWDDTLLAQEFGPDCYQPVSIMSFAFGDHIGQEDCLSLNIWRPRGKGVFPVMVFIHGGSYLVGSGSNEMNIGSRLAGSREIIVVTINYRLGPFGFLSHEALKDENPFGAGNYGTMDQIKALEWVQQNIAAFGGDPDNITLAGQSAGGVSVCTLLTSPAAGGLFQKAIMQSGGCDYCLSEADGFNLGEQMAEAVGCAEAQDIPSCLREKDPQTILEVFPLDPMLWTSHRFKCHIDGYVIPEQPLALLQKGQYSHIPTLIGCTQNEYSLFTWFDPQLSPLPLFWDKYELQVQAHYQEAADQILALYPSNSDFLPILTLTRIEGDRWFRCKARAAAMALTEHHPDTYLYHFTFDDFWLSSVLGSPHAFDVLFLFNSFDKGNTRSFFPTGPTPEALELSGALMDYFTNFALTANPNARGLPTWPAYDLTDRRHLVLDDPISLDNNFLNETCDFWDEYGRK